MIEEGPHEWEAPDWRMRCNSFSGIADSCPMNYKEIIHDLQGSDQAKDKELMGILDQIKERSVLFGQADDPFNFSSDEMAMLLPDVALNSDEKHAMISMLHPGSDGASFVKSDKSEEASGICKDYSDSEQGIMKYQDDVESVNPQKVFQN